MLRYETFRQQVQRNIVALISVFIAVSSLSYNTWRNEKSEHNRNQRQASFEVLLKLGELRELVGTSRYAIEAEIDHLRDMSLEMLRGLE